LVESLALGGGCMGDGGGDLGPAGFGGQAGQLVGVRRRRGWRPFRLVRQGRFGCRDVVEAGGSNLIGRCRLDPVLLRLVRLGLGSGVAGGRVGG
jgi:hypothetical protein